MKQNKPDDLGTVIDTLSKMLDKIRGFLKKEEDVIRREKIIDSLGVVCFGMARAKSYKAEANMLLGFSQPLQGKRRVKILRVLNLCIIEIDDFIRPNLVKLSREVAIYGELYTQKFTEIESSMGRRDALIRDMFNTIQDINVNDPNVDLTEKLIKLKKQSDQSLTQAKRAGEHISEMMHLISKESEESLRQTELKKIK